MLNSKKKKKKIRKEKIQKYSILGTAGFAGIGAPTGLIYGIPNVAGNLPSYANAAIIITVALLIFMITYLILKAFASLKKSINIMNAQNAKVRELVDKIAKANGMQGLYLDNLEDAEYTQSELDSRIQDTKKHKKLLEKYS